MVEANTVKTRLDERVFRRMTVVERIIRKVHRKKEKWAHTKTAKEIEEVSDHNCEQQENDKASDDADSLASDNSQDVIGKFLTL